MRESREERDDVDDERARFFVAPSDDSAMAPFEGPGEAERSRGVEASAMIEVSRWVQGKEEDGTVVEGKGRGSEIWRCEGREVESVGGKGPFMRRPWPLVEVVPLLTALIESTVMDSELTIGLDFNG